MGQFPKWQAVQKVLGVQNEQCTGVVLRQNVQGQRRCEENKSQYGGKECFYNGTTMYTNCRVVFDLGLKRSWCVAWRDSCIWNIVISEVHPK